MLRVRLAVGTVAGKVGEFLRLDVSFNVIVLRVAHFAMKGNNYAFFLFSRCHVFPFLTESIIS